MERIGPPQQPINGENRAGATTPPITVLNGEPILPRSFRSRGIQPEEFQRKFPVRYLAWRFANIQPIEGVHESTLENRLRALNNLDRYSLEHKAGRGQRTLRVKQFDVFTDIHSFLEEGNTEGYIEAPTGFGKTVLFAEVVKATGVKTLIVVPTKVLVEQTYERIKEFNPDLEIGRMYSDKKELGRQVTITTYQSLVLTHGGQNPEEFDLLILDEAHETLTEKRVEAVQQFKNAIKLGFTATPEYTKDKRVENLLNNEIHVITTKDAVEAGLLASFSVYLAETNVDLTNVKVTRSGEYDEQELEEAVDIESRNKSALDLYQKLIGENPDLAKAIIYCVSVKHAQNVARVFQEGGVRAAAIWGDMPKAEQHQIIQDYRHGKIDVISNVLLLAEGFDEPKAALCLNLKPTLSRVAAKQRGGRVLRLNPESPYKHAVIVDYLDKNEDRRNLQITFAQVAEGAQFINSVDIPVDPRKTLPGHGPDVGSPIDIDIDPRRITIDGLNVTTDAEEVLRIVMEIESMLYQKESPLEVQASDFVVSISNLDRNFIQGQLLRPLAFDVIEELLDENPDLVTKRKLGSNFITVVTDKNIFIQRMLARGIKLRNPYLEELSDGDLAITHRTMSTTFIGGKPSEIFQAARSVLDQIRREEPESVVQKKSSYNHRADIVINTGRFIELMAECGFRLRSAEELIETDFPMTRRHIGSYFLQRFYYDFDLFGTATAVLEDFRKNYPEIVSQRIVNGHRITVITEKERFVEEMTSRGAIRRADVEIRPSDFVISTSELAAHFVGSVSKLRAVAQEVIEQLKQENADSITQRLKRNEFVVTAIDKDKFIREMVKRGISLR